MARAGGLMGPGSPDPIVSPGRKPAVLAIHGFGGTPLEVELVVDVARELGLEARAPLLPGHGTNTDALALTGYPEWSRAADAALSEIASPGTPAIVFGLSLGSLLAAHLAATRPGEVLALGMLANATRLVRFSTAWPLRLIERLKLPDFGIPKTKGADIEDPVARKSHLTYSVQRVYGAIDVMRTGYRIEDELAKVTCPAFIAHGAHDHVCPVSNAELVHRALGSKDKTVVILPRSAHIVTRDYDRDVLRAEMVRFVKRVLSRSPS
ncbi:MAG TPA: alpha/beta fold hydrolase [Polyangiaceae bacterium]|nr:alpha/beta fold hydrolase [Polyangiaceae bacterium]